MSDVGFNLELARFPDGGFSMRFTDDEEGEVVAEFPDADALRAFGVSFVVAIETYIAGGGNG